MRLFLSVDMEGTTGLERLEEIFRGLPGYDTFRQLMAGDANAVIRGAIEGGATEIVVSNSHGYIVMSEGRFIEHLWGLCTGQRMPSLKKCAAC